MLGEEVIVKKILVVEDEFLIAMDIATMLERQGFEVVGPVGSLEEALTVADAADLDFALLDVNLGQGTSERVADVLRARGIPFAFVSGYDRASLPRRHRNELLVQKPISHRRLLGAIAA